MDKLRELTELVQRLGGSVGGGSSVVAGVAGFVAEDNYNNNGARTRLSELPLTRAFLDQLPRTQIEQTAKENEVKATEALRLLERVDELVESHTSTAASLTTFLTQLSTIPESLAQANSLALSIHNQLTTLSTLISSEEFHREQQSLNSLQHEQDVKFTEYAREKRSALDQKKEEYARQLDAFRRERLGLVAEKFVGGDEGGGRAGGGGGSGRRVGGSGGGGMVGKTKKKPGRMISSPPPTSPQSLQQPSSSPSLLPSPLPSSSLFPTQALSSSLPGLLVNGLPNFLGAPSFPPPPPPTTGICYPSGNPIPATTLGLEHVLLTDEEQKLNTVTGLDDFFDDSAGSESRDVKGSYALVRSISTTPTPASTNNNIKITTTTTTIPHHQSTSLPSQPSSEAPQALKQQPPPSSSPSSPPFTQSPPPPLAPHLSSLSPPSPSLSKTQKNPKSNRPSKSKPTKEIIVADEDFDEDLAMASMLSPSGGAGVGVGKKSRKKKKK